TGAPSAHPVAGARSTTWSRPSARSARCWYDEPGGGGPAQLRGSVRVLRRRAAGGTAPAVPGARVRPAGVVHQLRVDPARGAGLDPLRCGDRAAARVAGPAAGRA